MCTYLYCRISRKSQSIDRQIRNLKAVYPNGIVVQEAYTGTKLQGRKELDKLLKVVKSGDTIAFDSASRMSRNELEAIELYERLYNKGVELVFLKEPHINTEVYKSTLNNQIAISAATGNQATDNFIKGIIEALNKYTIDLAKEQIRLVFAQAQKEVDDLHIRTAEGLKTAALNGKQIGRKEGAIVITKKSQKAKEEIKKYSADFDGSLGDTEVIKLTGISRNSYYKYKKELREEIYNS